MGGKNCVLPESRPAGAFWADKIVTQGGVLVLRGGAEPRGDPREGLPGPPESQAGGTEGEPEALSQPVDPGGVGGFTNF